MLSDCHVGFLSVLKMFLAIAQFHLERLSVFCADLLVGALELFARIVAVTGLKCAVWTLTAVVILVRSSLGLSPTRLSVLGSTLWTGAWHWVTASSVSYHCHVWAQTSQSGLPRSLPTSPRGKVLLEGLCYRGSAGVVHYSCLLCKLAFGTLMAFWNG